MFRVVVADDEPAAARYLKTLVETAGPAFEVAAVAGNGEEALEAVRVHRPDLVLTDVRMPVLDGLGLAERLRAAFPGLPVVIVSGHQEFEYARRALALGVTDYLLKPVDPAALGRLLTDIGAQVLARSGQQVLEGLEALVAGRPTEVNLPLRFRVALVRWGGPVSRGRPTLRQGAHPEAHCWTLPGRDGAEALWLADADRWTQEAFEARVRALEPPTAVRTTTVLLADKPVAEADLGLAARNLGPAVDRLLVPGRCRTQWGEVPETPVVALDPLWVQKARLALQESAYHKLEALVRGLAADWDRDQRPARQAAGLVRQVLLLAQQDGLGGQDLLRDWEVPLEDGMGRADGYDDVADLMWHLFAGIAGLGPEPSGPTDAPETHQRIRRWVRTHFAEPLSIPLVCDRFQISQTSLSKLFRKYENQSFHEYLTTLRLDAAERLLAEAPGLPLKTVAACVGYADPFHFSRAFKAIKGRAPSQKPGEN